MLTFGNIYSSYALFLQWRVWVLLLLFFYCPISSHASDDQSAVMRALFAKAFGKKTAIPSDISVDLRINKISYGEVKIYSNKKQEMDKVEAPSVLKILKEVLKEEVFSRLEKEVDKQERIAFSQLSQIDINTTYNAANISLDLSISSELLKPRILSMLPDAKAGVHNSNNLQASNISGYINLYSNLDILDDAHDPKLQLRLESSLNIHNSVLESTFNINKEEGGFTNTTLTYDKPEKLYRYQIGNISTNTRGFQNSYPITGISLTKAFFMDPKLQIKPKANASFILETDSEVEVSINGTMQKRYHLEAGTYTLEDIGLFDGANNIVIRIKDRFGKITHKTTHQHYDAQLLKKDLSNFSISLGITEDLQEESNNKPSNKPSNKLSNKLLFSSYYQKGISSTLTLGLDAQLSHSHILIGSEVITPTSIGRLQLNTGISTRNGGHEGLGQSFIYYPTLKKELSNHKIDQLISSWSFRGEYRSKYFDQLTDISNTDSKIQQPKAKLQTNLGFRVSEKWRSHFIFGLSTDHHDDDTDLYSSLRLSKHFDNGITWNIDSQYKTDDELTVQTQLNIPLSGKLFGRSQNASFRYDSKDNLIESQYDLKPLGALGSNSFAGTLRQIHNDTDNQLNAEINYRQLKFETHINAKQSGTSQQLNLGFNSSLLCVESNCSFSYPISDSFALLTGPSNQDKPIAIKNGSGRFHYPADSDSELPDNYTALITDKKSPAVVLLKSYQNQRISVDEGGLPFGYDPEKTEFEVMPTYHSGYSFPVGGEPGVVVNGVLIGVDKKAMSFKGGQWVPEQEEGKIISFFTNKTGRFLLSSVPVGRYKLALFDHPNINLLSITVPDKKGEVYDAGRLIITINKAK